MPLVIEQQTRDIGLVRTPVGPDRTRIVVRPGDAIRIVDDAAATPSTPAGLKARRLDNTLIVDGLPGGQVIELNNFFGACRPGAECTVSLEGLGAKGAVLTENTAPLAPLNDGSFLLYGTPAADTGLAPLAAATVSEAAGPSWGSVLGAAGGLALVAGAAGGGGSGESATVPDTTRPAAPAVTSAPILKRSTPVISGTAEPGATVRITVDVPENPASGDPVFITTADAQGNWTLDLRSPSQSGALPPGGWPDGQTYRVTVQAIDAARNVSDPTIVGVTLDGTVPPTPTIGTIASDDVVNAAERDAGIVVSGQAESAASVAVTLAGTTLSTLASGTGAWSVRFEPAQLATAAGIVDVVAVASDAAGNASAAATRQVVFETTVPGAPVITDNVVGAVATGPITFTITFDEPVTGFIADDIVVTGGTRGAFTTVSESVYRVVVTPPAGQSGQVTVSVPAGAASDAAGNPSTAASPAIQAFDLRGPTLTISDDTPGPLTNDPVVFTFQWDEPVTGFAAGDIVVTGGTVTTAFAAGTAANSWTMTVTPTAGVDNGTISVSVAAGAVSDTAGNASTAPASATQAYDTAGPVVTITDNVAGATATGPVTFTFNWDEAVTGFATGDLNVTGGTITTPLAGSGDTYTLTVTPTAVASAVGVSVAAGAVSDALGNPSAAAGPATQAVDRTAPTLTITDNVDTVTTNDPVTFTFQWSEPVTGFVAGDVIVSGGTISSALAAGTTPNSYVLTVTPTPGTPSGTISVSVAAGVATDAIGNASAGPVSASQAYDTLAPAQTVDLANSAVNSDATLPVVNELVGAVASTTDTTPELVIALDDVLDTGETFQLLRDGAVVAGATIAAGDQSLTFAEPVALAADSYVYSGTITDAAGNLSQIPVFTVTVVA